MLRKLRSRPLVVRIFDIGGDKKVDLQPGNRDAHYFSKIGPEMNPALGCRAIRFLLRFPELLEAQLRAMIRASAFGEIHILIPMVSDLSELRQIRLIVNRICAELKEKEIPFSSQIPYRLHD